MRIARLLLEAFGPFTGRVLDFGERGTGLHVVYGPNEAGKSSALRAMTDLRFGIPTRSTDSFVHAYDRMRVGGVFVDGRGERVGLMRRKGNGRTLSRIDCDSGEPIDGEPVLDEHELALSGGLDRAGFEAMFGLDHARLRAGGAQLLDGEGELGAALFEASAGSRSVVALLGALETDAKKLFNASGHAKNAVINESRRQYDEHRAAFRAAQTRPADWTALRRRHEEARKRLDELTAGLAGLRRRDNDLAALRTVAPLLLGLDRAQATLAALQDAPRLEAGARERRLAAEQALARADDDQRSAQDEIARCDAGLAALAVDEDVLRHAGAIDRLAAATEAAAGARVEIERMGEAIATFDAAIDAIVGRILSAVGGTVGGSAPRPGSEDVRALLDAVPSDADRVALDQHVARALALGARIAAQRESAAALAVALVDEDADSALPDPEVRQAVTQALASARALGDVGRQHLEGVARLRAAETELVRALSDLGIADAAALGDARPLLDAEIEAARREAGAHEDALRALRDEDAKLARELAEQRERRRALELSGEVVTFESLKAARAARDERWGAVRAVLAGTDAAADRDALALAFEEATAEADRRADRLREDATRAAQHETCTVRIDGVLERIARVAAERAAVDTEQAEAFAAWRDRLSRGRLPELSPDALRDWQMARTAALALAARRDELRAEHARLAHEIVQASVRLGAALAAAGVPGSDDGEPDRAVLDGVAVSRLADRIALAAAWEARLAQRIAGHEAARRDARRRADELERAQAGLVALESEMAGHRAALRDWHARLRLPPDSSAEAVRARLDELSRLLALDADRSAERLRQGQRRATLDELARQGREASTLFGESAPVAVEDLVDRLRVRHAQAQEALRRRGLLQAARERANEQLSWAQRAAEAQATALGRLCADAGVSVAADLPGREAEADRRREAEAAVSQLREQLAEASPDPLETLRERVVGLDALAIDAEREALASTLARHEAEIGFAREAEEAARRELEAIDASDRAAEAREAMESAAARCRDAAVPWARLRLARALLQEALARHQARAQAPMVAHASAYFATMTGGRYMRLVAEDDERGRPELLAERDDGRRIDVEGMSEGTADQLYLALRLAALALRRDTHPAMPLVLDDVLMTSDDERATRMLSALAQFARGGQVLLFTHHRHVLDLARAGAGEEPVGLHSLA